MAKTVTCEFCGKELKTGFFSGDAYAISVGDLGSLNCCEHCLDTYQLSDKRERKRLEVKAANYKKTNRIRRISQQELLQLYLSYWNQRNEYQTRQNSLEPVEDCGYFHAGDGSFFVEEFALGSVSTTREMIRSIDKLGNTPVCSFSGQDITRLEYRLTSRLGTSTGFFKSAYIFEIRLNDPRELTYRPCISYFVSDGCALLPFRCRQKAEKKLVETLQILKGLSGTQAQITKVR